MLDRLLFQGAAGESYFLSRPTDTDAAYGTDVREAVQPIHVDSSNEISVCTSQYDFVNGVGPFTISRFKSDGTVVWSKQINVSLRGQTMTRDSSGNYYIASVANNTTFYLFKLDATGTLLWQKTITTPTSSVTVTGIRVDSTGANVYVCGYRIATNYYGFVVKITSAGAHSFTRTASTSCRFNSMTIDSSNNVYVCGYADATGGMLIMKFTSAGATSFSRRYYLSTGTGTARGWGNGISCDNSFIYVTASFNGNLHVLKMDLTGVIQWSRYANVTMPYREAPVSVGHDSSGNVYMGQGNGTNSFALFKFDSTGTLLWQRQTTANNSGIAAETVLVKDTNIYVAATAYDGGGGTTGIVFHKLPADGTLTNGTTYATASYTVGAAPATINQATATITVGTTAFTLTTPTFAVSADNIYLNKTTILQ